MHSAIATDVSANTRTAPLAISLTAFASGCHSCVTRSTMRSNAVLNISALMTTPTVKNRIARSTAVNGSKKATSNTMPPMMTWTFICRSSRIDWRNPFIACRNGCHQLFTTCPGITRSDAGFPPVASS